MKENEKSNSPKNEEIKFIVRDGLKSDITMSFSNKVQLAISTACSVSSSKEWSAIIFYKVSNLEKGFKSMHIEVIDMLIMDIGTEVHTSWEYNDDINDYMIANELLDNDICMGQLHSHVNMNAFFSGEDMSTLKQEALDREHNLSVVVNNSGMVVAKISRKISRKFKGEIEVTYPSFNEKIVREKAVIDNDENIIEFYDVAFKRVIDNDVRERMLGIIKKKNTRPATPNTGFFKGGQQCAANNGYDANVRDFIKELISCNIISKSTNGSIRITDMNVIEDTLEIDDFVSQIIDEDSLKRVAKKLVSGIRSLFTISMKDSDSVYDILTDAYQSISVDIGTFSVLDLEKSIIDNVMYNDDGKLKSLYNKNCYDFISQAELIYLYYGLTDFYCSYICQYLAKCNNISFVKPKKRK